MLNKCLKHRAPGHQSNECHRKVLNLVKAKANKIETNTVENKDGKETIELSIDEGEMLSYIVHKILLATKLDKDNQHNKIFRNMTPSVIRCAK